MAKAAVGKISFDLTKVVRQQQQSCGAAEIGSVVGETLSLRPITHTCCGPLFGFGVLFAAALWDLEYRFLRATGLLVVRDPINAVDVLLRAGLVLSCLAQFMDQWAPWQGREIPTYHLDVIGSVYFGAVCVSILLYNLERLMGRIGAPREGGGPEAEAGAKAECDDDDDFEAFFLLVNRRRIRTNAALLFTLALSGFFSFAVGLATLSAASTLVRGHDDLAMLNWGLILGADVVYMFNRLYHFKLVADQGSDSVAVAGLHTVWTACVSAPLSGVFLWYASEQWS